MKRWISKLHEDTEGAISVLVLLTIWCLVALIAMLWNTAEYAQRRRQIQNAADSAAHASAMWQSRTLNAIAGQNMAVSRDASAEAIWLASIQTGGDPKNDPNYPNAGSIYRELNKELLDAQAGRSRIRAMQARMRALSQTIEAEYALTSSALNTLSATVGKTIADPKQEKAYATKIRQAGSALNWVENTYVNGASPTAGRPGPPGPGGEGLYQLVDNWNIDTTTERKIFDFIESYITGVEMPILSAFQTQTNPATSQQLDVILQQHEQTIFAQEQSERDGVSGAIDQQVHRAPSQRTPDPNNVEDYYKATVTLATTKQQESEPTVEDGLGMAGSATVSAPVAMAMEADGTQGTDHYDNIRHSLRVIPCSNPPLTYLGAAINSGLPLTFNIDPISPHTIPHDGPTGNWQDATIWHPPMGIPLPTGIFWANCNFGGGWGHLWLMPMERYLNERIWRDQANIRQQFMQALDDSRWTPSDTNDLAHQIWRMQKLPPNPGITPLPKSIVDDTLNDQKGFDNISVLPQLQNPPNAPGAFNSEIMIYNVNSQKYLNAVQQLRSDLLLYVSVYEEFYNPFAVIYWDGAVASAHDYVMKELSQNGYFMILSTYKLRYIPDWARSSMRETIKEQVAQHIIEMNIQGMIAAIGGGGATGSAVRPFIGPAMANLTSTAYDAAGEIADEWVSRPWPYEIEPPHADSAVRPTYVPTGIPKFDRQDFFSAIAVAVDDKTPRLLLPKLFSEAKPLVAYAQGETFNWMEFNSEYGGNEQFDNPSWIPYSDFGAIGCPRGWRLSTVGGWNWQPRLSISDALAKALQLNPNLETGITTTDEATLATINLH